MTKMRDMARTDSIKSSKMLLQIAITKGFRVLADKHKLGRTLSRRSLKLRLCSSPAVSHSRRLLVVAFHCRYAGSEDS